MDRLLRHRWAKPAVFVLCLGPLIWLGGRALTDGLGANPIEATVRFLGDWALRFLLIALAVTPVRRIAGWPGLARFRRMLGLFAFFYVVVHLSSYIGLDQFFDWPAIGREIVKRRYITIGMAAAVLLLPLAITSTDAMIRRLGGQRWRKLHQLVYLIGPLGVTHHWMMVKKDLTEPMIHAVILALLLGWRVLAARKAARAMVPAFLLVIALLPSAPAMAAPKHCFAAAEITAEREIRHGIYLREAAHHCDDQYIKGSNDAWQKFEAANGPKFKSAMTKRTAAWRREFPDDWQYKITHADGRLVTYARNLPLTQGLCDNIDDLLQEIGKRGYGGFSAQAKRLQDEVVADYKVCR